MDPGAVRDAFDEQVRRYPAIVAPGEHVERDDRVVRFIAESDGWTGVTWCDLDEASADGVIASQIERFAELSRVWEWKHYSYDRPADLPDRLRAAGFTPESPEALLVGETADLPTAVRPPPGVAIVPVADEQGVASFIWVNDEVFGGDNAWVGKVLVADMARQPRMTRAVLAMAGNGPIAALRLEFAPETDFASLWSAAHWLSGAAAVCFARCWPTASRNRPTMAFATSRPTRSQTANLSSSAWASSNSAQQPRSSTEATAPEAHRESDVFATSADQIAWRFNQAPSLLLAPRKADA
jgi:hypothetical protein